MSKKTKNDLRSDVASGDHCLKLIKEQLANLGVHMDACPPMFYPEAIHNLFTWTAKASRECCALHGWHGGDEEKVIACIREQIEKFQQPETPTA